MPRDYSDEHVVDAIATLLGTSPEWDGAADYLEDIANLIGLVRPHPGDRTPSEYRREFKAATGREVKAGWDGGDDDE